MLIAAIVLPFLPGSRDPRAELEHAAPYSIADRFIPIPMYGVTIAIFLGIVVLWQMRKEPRPLPDALVAQRVQAYVGIALALLATVILYAYVALHGPR
jgi:TRAP-type C4-dicarboxylate transport system permease large subunit